MLRVGIVCHAKWSVLKKPWSRRWIRNYWMLLLKGGFAVTRLIQHRYPTLQWRHNGRDGVSNHQHLDCLLNRLFWRRSKKTSKLRVTGFCEGNSPVTGEFPSQRASNTENVSIWRRHHEHFSMIDSYISSYVLCVVYFPGFLFSFSQSFWNIEFGLRANWNLQHDIIGRILPSPRLLFRLRSAVRYIMMLKFVSLSQLRMIIWHVWKQSLIKRPCVGENVNSLVCSMKSNLICVTRVLIHYDDAIKGAIGSQITSLMFVYPTVYSGADQSKHQSSASLAFVWGIHRGPVNSPHKWPVTRKMFPFDDVIM